jgi:hypothetical protein
MDTIADVSTKIIDPATRQSPSFVITRPFGPASASNRSVGKLSYPLVERPLVALALDLGL